MSHTHCFYRPEVLNRETFNLVVHESLKVASIVAKTTDTPLRRFSDSTETAVFGIFSIEIADPGGIGDRFKLERIFSEQPLELDDRGLLFQSCDTLGRPYGAVVCSVLLVCKHRFGKSFDLQSQLSVTESDWVIAKRACQDVLGYGSKFNHKV